MVQPSENFKSLKSLIGMPVLEEAHTKWVKGLSYSEVMNLARLYEKEVDDLVLKLFRITDEARCHQVTHTIVQNAPEIVQALLYERYVTVLGLFERLEQKPEFNATAYGQGLLGMLSLYHQFLRLSEKA